MASVLQGQLALIASWPFLFPFHTEPIPTFWSEWWAASLVFLLVITGLIAGYKRQNVLVLPLALALPAILLTILLLHFATGRLPFPAVGLLHAGYLLWAAVLMVLGRLLADMIGLDKIAAGLAAGFLLGSLLNVCVALLQWGSLSYSYWWAFDHPGGSISANLGQANHHAHYAWLGIASAFYLYGRKQLGAALFWPIVLLLAFGSVLGGSRSVFLYAIVLPIAVSFAYKRSAATSAEWRSLRRATIVLLPAVVALSFVASTLTSLVAAPVTASGERLFAAVTGSSIRIELAQMAWTTFVNSPWLGHGVGNFSWASFTAAAAGLEGIHPHVAEHAHSFILHLLVEYGGPATLGVLAVLLIWARDFVRQPWRTEHFWCASILAIGLIHGLLEYPHWYAYFLGPTALLLGAVSTRRIFQPLPARRAFIYLGLVASVGAITLFNLHRDYAIIERVTYRPLSLHADREESWLIAMDALLKLHRESLLSPWALLGLASIADPSDKQANERATICERAIRFSPARLLATRCAIQQAIAGKRVMATKLLSDALRAYPDYHLEIRREVDRWASVYPDIAYLVTHPAPRQ